MYMYMCSYTCTCTLYILHDIFAILTLYQVDVILCFFYQALSDKDSLLGFINAVHDSHMLAIDNKVHNTV